MGLCSSSDFNLSTWSWRLLAAVLLPCTLQGAINAWRENFNHQHQRVRTEGGIEYGDLIKFDDFDYIAQIARLNMATLATLA
jgi:hypothetical protein